MQGKARETLRSLDWTRPMKQRVIAYLADTHAHFDDEDDPYAEFRFAGAAELLRVISPEVTDELLIDATRKDPS